MMEYAATSEFPAAMQDRLSRIRTVTVEWDRFWDLHEVPAFV